MDKKAAIKNRLLKELASRVGLKIVFYNTGEDGPSYNLYEEAGGKEGLKALTTDHDFYDACASVEAYGSGHGEWDRLAREFNWEMGMNVFESKPERTDNEKPANT